MARLSIISSVLVGCALGGPLVFLACQGSLELTQPGTSSDMSGAVDMASETTPGQISFADIERDLEKSSFSCSNGAGGCHGGTMPTGLLKLISNASLNQNDLMANYQQVLTRVDTTMPEQSVLLLKTLMTSTTTHVGIKPFANAQDATYQRWLLWIKLGANFQPVPTTGTGDM